MHQVHRGLSHGLGGGNQTLSPLRIRAVGVGRAARGVGHNADELERRVHQEHASARGIVNQQSAAGQRTYVVDRAERIGGGRVNGTERTNRRTCLRGKNKGQNFNLS